MKRYVNGYSSPRFLITHSLGNTETVNISLKFQGLREYIEDKYIMHEDLSGALKPKFLYTRKYFELDFSALLTSTDAFAVQRVDDACRQGKPVSIIPHAENPAYIYRVTVVPDKRSLGLHYGGLNSFGNKDFIINFQTIEPLYELGWLDPDNLNSIIDDEV